MTARVAFVALLVWGTVPAFGQSEDAAARRLINGQLASTWNEVRENLADGIRESVKSGREGVDCTALDIKAPPALTALDPRRISVRIPDGRWEIQLRWSYPFRKRIKWGRWSWTIDKVFHIYFTLSRLRVDLNFDLDGSELPRVKRASTRLDYQLNLRSSNLLIEAGLSIANVKAVVELLNPRLVKLIASFLMGWKLQSLVQTAAERKWGSGLPDYPSASSHALAQVAGEMRDATVQGNMEYDVLGDSTYDAKTLMRKRHEEEGDSAIRTGTWLAAMAMAYRQTHDPKWQSAAHKALVGIDRLLKVGSSPDYYGPQTAKIALEESRRGRLSRYAAKAGDFYEEGRTFEDEFKARVDSPLNTDKEVLSFWTDPQGQKWVAYPKHISRDQYAGVVQGLTWSLAYLDDPKSVELARSCAKRIAGYILRPGHEWTFDHPSGRFAEPLAGFIPHQLSFLLMALKADSTGYAEPWKRNESLASAAWFTAWTLTFDRHGGYFKYNLIYSCLSSLVRFDPARSAKYRYALRILRKAVGDHQNPYFTAVTAMSGTPGEKASASEQIRRMLNEFLERPRFGALPSSAYPPYAQKIKDYLDKLPRQKYESSSSMDVQVGDVVDLDAKGPVQIAGVIVPIPFRPTRSYFWDRSPYELGFSPNSEIVVQYPGADYQICYWLARDSGLLNGK